jgi:hypothetical protein
MTDNFALLDTFKPESLKYLLSNLQERCHEKCNRLWGSGRKQNCKLEKCQISLENIFKQIRPIVGELFNAQVYEKLQKGDAYIWTYFLEYLLSDLDQFMNLMRNDTITMTRRLRNVYDISEIRNNVFIQFCFYLQLKTGKSLKQLHVKGALNNFILEQIKKIFKETKNDELILAIYEKYGYGIFKSRIELKKILNENDNFYKKTLFTFLCIILGYGGCQRMVQGNNPKCLDTCNLKRRLRITGETLDALSFYDYVEESLLSYGINLHTFCNNVIVFSTEGLLTEDVELLDAYVGGRIKTKNRQRGLKRRNKRTRRFNKY